MNKKIIYITILILSLFGGLGTVFASPIDVSAVTPIVTNLDDPNYIGPPAPPADTTSSQPKGECSYDSALSVQGALSGCKPQGSITSDNYTIAGGVKAKVTKITNQLLVLGSLLAVGAIVFAAILYVAAIGDGEKIKKAKTSLKFAIIGFAVMLLSFPIVNAIVNLIYGIGK